MLYIQNRIKKLTKKAINKLLLTYGRYKSKKYDIKNTIILSCTGRSGSTWLAEIIESLPNKYMIYEPFHIISNPRCKRYGFSWNTYINPESKERRKKRYAKKVLTGREISLGTIRRDNIQIVRLIKCSRYVVKTINANMMLGWLNKSFPIKPVLLIRHPCAVVASQISHEGWNWSKDKKNLTVPDGLFKDFPHLQEVYKGIEHKEEVLAFEWAMQNLIPLRQGKNFVVTTYERLVENGNKEVMRILSGISEKVSKEKIRQLNEPSSSSSSFEDKKYNRKENLLTDWKRRLSYRQAKRILTVVHNVGINFYTQDIYPNYDDIPYIAK